MRLRTIGLISTLALVLLAGLLPANAQQAGKVYHIGYLSGFYSPATDPGRIPFRQGMGELGHVEGQNLVIEYRYRKRDQFAAELVRLKVDVIVTSPGPPTIRAAN